ncbi:hypothetical protein F66182_4855 [Fusarium sp. NRRL 66182]|nr:hypothetical protein F66182_4855 [Fusarium sp. NRRL 66182]
MRVLSGPAAQELSGAAAITPVDSPGSMSYTVVCSGCPGPLSDIIVSFREQCALLDGNMIELAKAIHGDLVPESTCKGIIEGSDPPLSIYSMPYLRGSSYIEALSFNVNLDPDEEAKHITFVKSLARHFARSWLGSQQIDHQTQQDLEEQQIQKRLYLLMQESSLSILFKSMISELIELLPSLFSQDYPKVLTHNDFSVTNILVEPETLEITGIVDWSLASIMPFGLDLDMLFLAMGFSTREGWHYYTCQPLLHDTFWDEFFSLIGSQRDEPQRKMRILAECASKVGAILRLAFRRKADGSPSEEMLLSESRIKQLKAWLET